MMEDRSTAAWPRADTCLYGDETATYFGIKRDTVYKWISEKQIRSHGADAFKRAQLVERTARGIDTIFFEQLRNGRPAPSYDPSNESSAVLVLPGGKANLDFVRLVVEESQKNRILSLDELLILNHLWWERQITSAEAAMLIQKPELEARSRLQRLLEAGLVEPRGKRKGRIWHLSVTAYRWLGQKATYARQ